jgi:hypothetical protein
MCWRFVANIVLPVRPQRPQNKMETK